MNNQHDSLGLSGTHNHKSIRDIFDAAPIPLTLAQCDLTDLPLVLVNKPFLKLTGYRASDVLGRNCRFLQGEADNARERQLFRKATENAESVSVSIINQRKNRSRFKNRVFLFPLFSVDGQLKFYLGTQFEEGKPYASWRLRSHIQSLRNSFDVEEDEELTWEFPEIAATDRDDMLFDKADHPTIDDTRQLHSISLKSIVQSQLLSIGYH